MRQATLQYRCKFCDTQFNAGWVSRDTADRLFDMVVETNLYSLIEHKCSSRQRGIAEFIGVNYEEEES